MVDKFPITPKGYEKLTLELTQLKTKERPKIIDAIAEARAHGDLSENAEYHSAKEKQGFIEAKIADLESKLARSEIIDTSKLSGDRVVFGAYVELLDEETQDKVAYTIVSDYEAYLENGYISTSSPLAKALMSRKVGDSIEVATPKGLRYYEILAIKFN